MPRIGWHASHEQISPAELLRALHHAEQAGFQVGMSSDHFSPWSARQGHSGFAWSWLGAAMATTSLPFRVVTAPGQRYHPAIIAQAMATLVEMFPERLWVCLGSGEASNEHITGDRWPPKPVRNARLRECVDVIRALLAGEEVTHDGLVRVDRARIWSRPEHPPPLIGAAVSEETARWVGGWADGLATIHRPPEALAIAWDQWRTNVFAPPVCWDLELVEHFDEAARHVRPEDVRGSVLVSSDLPRHVEWLREAAALGFDEINIHHVGQRQEAFIDAFGREVLPALAAT
jgi:G6PDH family F420-dependent oxidoreductase